MKRRDILKSGTAAAAVLAGCTTFDRPPTPTPSRPTSTPPRRSSSDRLREYAGRFGSVVEAESSAFEPGGGQTLNAFLEDIATDDTLVHLPSGRYQIDDTWAFPAFDNFGIVGNDASIVPPEGYDDSILVIGQPDEASGLLIDGVTFDYRAERTGGRPLNAKVRDRLEIRDVSVVGQQDVEAQMFRFDVTGEDGTGLVERLSLPDGAIPASSSYGCFVGDTNQGDITFRDCHIAGFPDNGIYAEPEHGTVSVLGGRYENNNVSNIRVGSGGLIRGVHVRCDTAPEEFGNMRGIRLREGSDTVIENCLVELLNVTGSDGAITLAPQMNAATIRNTRIRIDIDNVAGILAKPPSTNDAGQSLNCENVCIEGSARNTAAILVNGRDGCVFNGLSIHQTGENRDGIELLGSSDSVLFDSRISVTSDPVVLVDSALERSNVWTNDDPRNTNLDCEAV